MKVSIQSIMAGVSAFIDHEIVPLGASMKSLDQFLFGMKIGIIRGKLEAMVKDFVMSDMAKAIQLVDDEGKVDIDILYQSAMSSIKPITYVEVAGIRLNENDITKLYNYIKERS
jgi:hypothetical protein